MTRARIVSVAFAGLAAVLVLGAIAWACTPSAYLYPVSPARAPAGTEVSVRGGQFGTGPVDLRWGSQNGRLLATTLGPEFTVSVTIPDRPEGVHYIVAVARDPANPSRVLARRAEAIEITSNPKSEARAAASLWSDAREPVTDEGGLPSAAVAMIGLGFATAGAGLFALVVLRRRKAQSH